MFKATEHETPINTLARTWQRKLHMLFIGRTFEYLMSLNPFSKEAGRHAMMRHIRRYLDNPINDKNFDILLKDVRGEAEIKTVMQKTMEQSAGFGQEPYIGIAKTWNIKGKIYLDRNAAKEAAKKAGMRLPGSDVQNMALLANQNDLRNVLGREPTKKDYFDKDLRRQMKLNGKSGIINPNGTVTMLK